MTILEHAKPANQINVDPSRYRFKGLLCGHTGSGKSNTALTAPGKKLLIEYDGRRESIIGHPELENTEIIQILEADSRSPKAWDALEQLRRELVSLARKSQTFPYDCIIEDGLTFMGTYCMNWCLLLDSKRGLGGAAAQQHYGPYIKNLGDHIQAMRNLPCSYILTSHFNAVEDEATGSIKYFPKVYGKQFRTDVPTMFNECYFCTKIDRPDEDTHKNRRTYVLFTGGTGRYDFFKSALNYQELFWTDPVIVDLKNRPYGIQKLLHLRFGKEESTGPSGSQPTKPENQTNQTNQNNQN